jgi:hypothetical protein
VVFPGLNDNPVLVLLVGVVWLELPLVPVAPDEAVLGLPVDDAEVPASVPVVFEDVPLVLPLVDVAPEVFAPVPAEPEGSLYV